MKKAYKLIILVIASHGLLYDNFKSLWDRYDKTEPNIKVIYIYGSASILTSASVAAATDATAITLTPISVMPNDNNDDCNIVSLIEESLKPGVLIKTLDALEYIEENYDYDILLRTNLSSFYIFSRLSKYVDGLPREKLYEGVIIKRKSGDYGSGAGFFLTRDLVRMLIDNRAEVEIDSLILSDDRLIGRFFKSKGIKVRTNRHRYDICHYKDERTIIKIINRIRHNDWYFHIRFKYVVNEERLRIDTYGMSKALEFFYTNINNESTANLPPAAT